MYDPLSFGNRKISKNVAIFSLPAMETCPNKTEICERYCYAKQAQMQYSNVMNHRLANLQLTIDGGFVEFMSDAIRKSGKRKVRIHESGDFYSQKYLNMWIKIAKKNPKVKFLAYTKSFNLDFTKCPKNMIIYFSFDSTNKKFMNYRKGLKTFTSQNIHDIIKGYHVCTPVGKGKNNKKDINHYRYCGDRCNICWNGSKNVVFLKH